MANRDSDVGRIGGGWIAAAVGLSEYRSPLDAYLRITGEVEDVLEGEAIDRGVFLEPALREWHKKKVGAADIIQLKTQRHRQHRWASYTPDGVIVTTNHVEPASGLAEYKSPGDDAAAKYGEPGTDQVPRDVGVQVHWGLFVTDLPKADVAALIGGELSLYHLKSDADLSRELFERAQFFMREYVEKKRPPPPTFSERDTEWVKKRWPKNDPGKRLIWSELTDEKRRLLSRYVELYQEEKRATRALWEVENAVKTDVFQDASDITAVVGDESSPFSRIDWKNNASAGPAWKKVAEDFVEQMEGWAPNAAALIRTTFEGSVRKHTPEATPRVFKPYFRRSK